MKSTCPTSAPRVGDPTPPIFHLLALGLALEFCVAVEYRLYCYASRGTAALNQITYIQ